MRLHCVYTDNSVEESDNFLSPFLSPEGKKDVLFSCKCFFFFFFFFVNRHISMLKPESRGMFIMNVDQIRVQQNLHAF